MTINRPIRAVLCDLDGTLYHQGTLRCLMALELCALPLLKRSCRSACCVWRCLRDFRRIREELRTLGEAEGALAMLQYREAAKKAGVSPDVMQQVVAEWIYQRPLKYLRFCRHRGIEEFFVSLQRQGIQIGVLSDYPAWDKLKALCLDSKVSLTLCSTDPEINAFKPHPKGFLHACEIWGIEPEEVLYVGDRPEVDAAGAAHAGMPCAILGKSRKGRDGLEGFITFDSFKDLQNALIAND